jgi:hypothetical protein
LIKPRGLEYIIAPIYKKGDKTECSNYHRILFLKNLCKILQEILLLELIAYEVLITGHHQVLDTL